MPKYTKWAKNVTIDRNIPIQNGHKIYIPIFSHPRPSKNIQIGIFGVKINVPSGNPGHCLAYFSLQPV
jgi:hypothetical protein